MEAQQAAIEFIERVAPMDDFRDALAMSRKAMELSVGGDVEEMTGIVRYIFPKLRFAWLNMQRYIFASRYLRQDDFVLDVPCGTGYGTAILGSNGNDVLGLDIDRRSIETASDMYKFRNVHFDVADMMNDELPKADFITCLDGLEHVSPGYELIERFVGALSDDGILVVSVPVNELKITGGIRNPYHEEDYDMVKLTDLLSRYFSSVQLFGHDLMGSISDISSAFDGITAVCEV